MNRSRGAIPVGGLYIVAFLVLMGLAGMGLYLYLNGQSTARDYRIASASLLQVGEEFKRFIDQERLFVVETVLYFLGSQGGVENIQDYNAVDLTKISDIDNPLNPEAKSCYDLLSDRMGSPSNEILYQCFNGDKDLFYNPESEGIWKCDTMMYSYKECAGITLLGAKVCCTSATYNDNIITYQEIENNNLAVERSGVMGYTCHEGCLNALENSLENPIDYTTICSEKDYCGALWCKADNLEVPETYDGAPYYYKIGEGGPGYYCPSSYDFSPEQEYADATLWANVDSEKIINQLLNLSNNYFYVPSPKFTQEINDLFDSNIKIAFQLAFRGCDNYDCEFVWVPYGESQQGFIGRGFGGVPMVEFSTDLLSVQTIPIPVEDMVNYIVQIISDKRIGNYLVNALEGIVYQHNFNANSEYTSAGFQAENSLNDWRRVYGEEVFGINCGGTPVAGKGESMTTTVFDYYDDRYCGEDPYNNDCDYRCLMQHASTNLYDGTSNPYNYDRDDGYDYTLRPVYRFVESSMGAAFDVNAASSDTQEVYNVQLLDGDYHVFVKGAGANNLIFIINSEQIKFSTAETGEYYEAVTGLGTLGRCSQGNKEAATDSALLSFNPGEYESLSDFAEDYGCCREGNYNEDDNTCSIEVLSNNYCTQMHNGYGNTVGGEACILYPAAGELGNVDFDNRMIHLNGAVSVTIAKDSSAAISDLSRVESVDIVRVDYDDTLEIKNYQSNGISYDYGGSHEYYLDSEVSDCSNPMGADFKKYDAMTDVEAWYSVFCLRSQGLEWSSIMEDYSGLFSAFKNKLSDIDAEAEKMDAFINKFDNNRVYFEEGIPTIRFNAEEEVVLAGNNELTYSEQTIPFKTAETLLDRIYEINQNTNYISLPMKWIFAYRDRVSFNQVSGNLEGNTGCDVQYSDITGARGPPDCSCKTCLATAVCNFDFENVKTIDLVQYLYKFGDTFIGNYYEYKTAGVME